MKFRCMRLMIAREAGQHAMFRGAWGRQVFEDYRVPMACKTGKKPAEVTKSVLRVELLSFRAHTFTPSGVRHE